MAALGTIDVPLDGQLVAREGFLIEGFGVDEQSGPFRRISIQQDGEEIAFSTVHYARPDVATLRPDLDPGCGYKIFVSLPPTAPERNTLTVVGEFPDGNSWALDVTVTVGPHDYTAGPYGTLVDPNVSVVYHREDIYGVGPPSSIPSEECVRLLERLLTPGENVVDVGCGVGAYAAPLLAAGIAWHGCEVNADFVADMSARDLPATQVVDGRLPFDDAAFDSAVCIEVLEHILDIAPFLDEIVRVSPHRAIFSVPNAEAIPILADRLVVPWHVLEADHKNFFNRSSLHDTLSRVYRRVEIVPYGVMPVPSSNGTPVHYHLLAVADNDV